MKGILIFLLVFTFAIALPADVFAVDPDGLVTCTDTDCNFCTFLQMFNIILDWVMGLLVLIAVLLIVVTGVKLVVSAGNPSAMQSAKSTLSNVIIGFVIILAAWLIVDTMLIALTGGQGFGVWSDIECG